MFSPNVVGQSGTAIPASVLVTIPPKPISASVIKAVAIAKRWSQTGCWESFKLRL